MAHFYGDVSGRSSTTASRLGTARSGLTVRAASWQGSISVQLYEKDGVDYANVIMKPWHGVGNFKVLYSGPVSGMEEQDNVGASSGCEEG
jgi:hypothetical protein